MCKTPNISELNMTVSAVKPVEVNYGFVMDDVESVRNISGVQGMIPMKIRLYPDPDFIPFPDGTMTFSKSAEYLTIDVRNV